MENILLAIQKDLMGNDVKAFYGNVPWDGIKKASIDDIQSGKIEIDNIRVSDKGEIVNTRGNVKKYTTLSDGTVIKRSYTVLAKSVNTGSTVYFMTTGLDNPIWVRSEDLKEKLLHEHIELSNSRLEFGETEISLEPLEAEEFDSVDFREIQLEYRKYLKSTK